MVIIFKIAGIKDGLYTVHQLDEISSKNHTPDPELRSTTQIDEFMKTKILANPGATADPDISTAIANAIGSNFLINFPKEFPEIGKEMVDKLDLTKFVQAMFKTIPPDELFSHSELDGTRKTTLQKFDATSATFGSSLAIKIKVTPPEESGVPVGSFSVDASGTVVIDRLTGMPWDYKIQMKINVLENGKTETLNLGMHLIRK